MHVRRGDACVHAAQSNTRPLCRPLTDYLAPLAEMRGLYKAHTVFLSTDDAQVERDAPALLAQMGIKKNLEENGWENGRIWGGLSVCVSVSVCACVRACVCVCLSVCLCLCLCVAEF